MSPRHQHLLRGLSFLDPESIGTLGVAANVGVLAAGFLALGYLLAAAGRATVRLR